MPERSTLISICYVEWARQNLAESNENDKILAIAELWRIGLFVPLRLILSAL